MRMNWRGALGIALSALLLWWTLRGEDLGEVARVLRESDPWYWLAATIAGTVIFPLRALRWRVILAPLEGRLPFAPLWQATAIGMMINNVAPLRAGEFARAFVLSRSQPRIPFTAAFASLGVDRIFDAVVVFGLLLLATLDPAFPSDARVGTLTVGAYSKLLAIVLGSAVAALYLLVLFPTSFGALAEGITGRIAPKFAPRVRALVDAFSSGLAVLRSPSLTLSVLGWTLLHWLMNALAFWFGFRALGIEAPLTASLFLQGVIAIGVALPSSPGFFGVFEAAATSGLLLYGIANTPAVSWALGFHILTFIPITVIGAWYFTRLELHFRDLWRAADASHTPEPDR